jgi:hypothetical protein
MKSHDPAVGLALVAIFGVLVLVSIAFVIG